MSDRGNCPDCIEQVEAQAAEIEAYGRSLHLKQTLIEEQAAEIVKLREAWLEYFEAKTELADLERAQDLTKRFDEALYKLQYAEDKALAALGETK